MWLLVLNALLFATFPLIIRTFHQRFDNLYDITFLRYFIAMCVLLFLFSTTSIFSSPQTLLDVMTQFSGWEWILLSMIGVLSVATITLYQYNITTTPLTTLFPVIYPVSIAIGMIYGVVLYEEKLTAKQLSGVALAVTSIFMMKT